MMSQSFTVVFVRLATAFLAAFPAVALWSQSRDPAWMLVVLGALFLFIDALYAAMVLLGVVTYGDAAVLGAPLLQLVFSGLPFLTMAAGFLVFLFRHRRY